MKRAEVTNLLMDIKNVYPNFTLNDAVAEAWVKIFQNYEYEPMAASFNKYAKSNEYCPVPASIIKIYNEGKAKMDSAVGRDYGRVMELLTSMNGANVFSEVEYYRQWTKTLPEMYRMQQSAKMVRLLEEYQNDHIGLPMNFYEWLDKNKERVMQNG